MDNCNSACSNLTPALIAFKFLLHIFITVQTQKCYVDYTDMLSDVGTVIAKENFCRGSLIFV